MPYPKVGVTAFSYLRLPPLMLLQVITVNQVVDILVRVQGSNDWKAALEQVLPGRKRADPAAAAAAAPPSGDKPEAAAGSAGTADAAAADAANGAAEKAAGEADATAAAAAAEATGASS
jgi:hypothetical protein